MKFFNLRLLEQAFTMTMDEQVVMHYHRDVFYVFMQSQKIEELHESPRVARDYAHFIFRILDEGTLEFAKSRLEFTELAYWLKACGYSAQLAK